jgi:hypothetical protein
MATSQKWCHIPIGMLYLTAKAVDSARIGLYWAFEYINQFLHLSLLCHGGAGDGGKFVNVCGVLSHHSNGDVLDELCVNSVTYNHDRAPLLV